MVANNYITDRPCRELRKYDEHDQTENDLDKPYRKPTAQSRMDNPEKTEGVIKNRQSRETGNIGYTRHRKNKRLTKTEGAIKNRQSRETCTIRYTRHRTNKR